VRRGGHPSLPSKVIQPPYCVHAVCVQVVVFCPNIGVLCGVVLSLVPMLLPFSWQSLLLPVLPATQQRLEIMEVRSNRVRVGGGGGGAWGPLCKWTGQGRQ
jgi:hypothetical protein